MDVQVQGPVEFLWVFLFGLALGIGWTLGCKLVNKIMG